jgi:hypothetical protein
MSILWEMWVEIRGHHIEGTGIWKDNFQYGFPITNVGHDGMGAGVGLVVSRERVSVERLASSSSRY